MHASPESSETISFGLSSETTAFGPAPDGSPISEYVPDYHELVPYVPKQRNAKSKYRLVKALAIAADMTMSDALKFLDSLAEIGTKETVNVGKFTVPGLVMIRTKVRPATVPGKRKMFGKEVAVKANPAKTVVKAFPTAKLKKSI